MKEGRKPEYPEKTPDDKLQKMPLYTKAWKFKPQARLEPTLQHWWQARKADVLITQHWCNMLQTCNVRDKVRKGQNLSKKAHTHITVEINISRTIFSPQIFKGASSSKRIGWLRNISLDFKHKPRTSDSVICTVFPGRHPLAAKTQSKLWTRETQASIICYAGWLVLFSEGGRWQLSEGYITMQKPMAQTGHRTLYSATEKHCLSFVWIR